MLGFVPKFDWDKNWTKKLVKNFTNKICNFWPKSKGIGLHFCKNLTRTKMRQKISQNFQKKIPYIWPKNKAIGLVFCQHLTGTRIGRKNWLKKFHQQNLQFLAKK